MRFGDKEHIWLLVHAFCGHDVTWHQRWWLGWCSTDQLMWRGVVLVRSRMGMAWKLRLNCWYYILQASVGMSTLSKLAFEFLSIWISVPWVSRPQKRWENRKEKKKKRPEEKNTKLWDLRTYVPFSKNLLNQKSIWHRSLRNLRNSQNLFTYRLFIWGH